MKSKFTLKPLPIAFIVIFLIGLLYVSVYISIDKKSIEKRIKYYITQNFPGSTFSFKSSNYFLSNRINYQINDFKIITLQNYIIEVKSLRTSFALSAVLGGRRAKLFAKDVIVRFKSARAFYQIFENRTAFSELKVHKILKNNEVGLNAENISLVFEDTENTYFFRKIYLRNINQKNYTAGEIVFKLKDESFIRLNGEINILNFFRNKPSVDGTLSFIGFKEKFLFLNNLKLKIDPSLEEGKGLFKAQGKSNVWGGEFKFNLRNYELSLFDFNMDMNKDILLDKQLADEFSDCKEKSISLTGETKYFLTEKKIVPKVSFENSCFKASIDSFGELVRWNLGSESKKIKFYKNNFDDEEYIKREVFFTTRENIMNPRKDLSQSTNEFLKTYVEKGMLQKVSLSELEELHIQEGEIRISEKLIGFQELKVLNNQDNISIEFTNGDEIEKYKLIESQGVERFEKI